MNRPSSTSSSLVARLFVLGAMLVSVASVVVTGVFVYEAWALASEPEPDVDTALLESYRADQDAMLDGQGLADDRALGGMKGETKRSEKLGFKRFPVAAAKDQVVTAMSKGSFEPTTLSEEQADELERMAMGGVSPEDLLAASKDPKEVAKGAEIFAANCASCHGAKANGLVGPNLTDEYFIHGPRPQDVYRTISQGVLTKGMPSWTHLGQEKMEDATAYVLSIMGTNVEGKEPQGVDRDGNPPPS